VWLDYISDPEYVNVGFESSSETPCGTFST
jgi:hypothetical protein